MFYINEFLTAAWNQAAIVACHPPVKTQIMPDNNPRFLTAHDAGKYVSAQLYPAARGLNAEEFGAVKRYIPNPVWQKAPFAVAETTINGQYGLAVVDLQTHSDDEVRTPLEWYNQHDGSYAIVFADGFTHDEWAFVKMTESEYFKKLELCTIY